MTALSCLKVVALVSVGVLCSRDSVVVSHACSCHWCMQSLERVHAQESCRCVAGVAVVCRSCGVPV